MLLIILQDILNESIWSKLLDHGLTILLLAVAVYVLWKRDQTMQAKQDSINERMNNYLEEDRKEMLTVIQNNTEAFKKFSDTLESILNHKQLNS
jgi:type II secretory pathway component PulC